MVKQASRTKLVKPLTVMSATHVRDVSVIDPLQILVIRGNIIIVRNDCLRLNIAAKFLYFFLGIRDGLPIIRDEYTLDLL